MASQSKPSRRLATHRPGTKQPALAFHHTTGNQTLLTEALESLLMEETLAGRPVKALHAAARLGQHQGTVSRLLTSWSESRKVVALPGYDGFVWAGVLVDGAPRVTLADLLERARARTSPSAKARKGRQSLEASRDIHELTPVQLADIERLVRRVILPNSPQARVLAGDGSPALDDQGQPLFDPARVGGRDFVWDPTADGGRGGWALLARVTEWVEADHRAEYEARLQRQGFVWQPTAGRGAGAWVHPDGRTRARWTREAAAASVRDYRGATNNLLYVCATGDDALISRAARRTDGRLSTGYDVRLAPLLARWRQRLTKGLSKDERKAFTYGLRSIAIAMTDIGVYDCRPASLAAVRAHLLAEEAAGRIPTNRFSAIRRVWRKAVEYADERLVVAGRQPAPPAVRWPIQRESALTLVPVAGVHAAAVIEGDMMSRDFSKFVSRGGRFMRELVDGWYGLRAYVAWRTLPASKLEDQPAPLGPLPRRVWYRGPEEGSRFAKLNAAPRTVSQSTLETELEMIVRLAGWAEEHRELDFEVHGLEALCDKSLIAGYVQYLESQPKGGSLGRANTIHRVVSTFYVLVNGWFTARAAQRIQLAERILNDRRADEKAKRRATGLVERGRDELEKFLEQYDRFLMYSSDLRDERPKKTDEQIAAEIAELAEAWRGDGREEGYVTLVRLRDLKIAEACAAAQDTNGRVGLTLDEQHEAIRAGVFVPTMQWARSLRMAMLIHCAILIPLRRRAWSLFELYASEEDAERHGRPEHWGRVWENTPVGEEQCSRAVEWWEGAIRWNVVKEWLKGQRDSTFSMILEEHVRTATQEGSEAHELGVHRSLLRAYLCEGGARDWCRTVWDHDAGRLLVADVPFLFPHLLPRGDGSFAQVVREAQRNKQRPPFAEPRQWKAGSTFGRWEKKALAKSFSAVVLRHAATLGLDPKRLRRRGFAGTHVLRKLYGSFWAPRNLVFASKMLNHRDVDVTLKHYVAVNTRVFVLSLADELGKQQRADSEQQRTRERERREAHERYDRLFEMLAAEQRRTAQLTEELTALRLLIQGQGSIAR